ncbi:sensor histidine kinase [Cohnella herbarum]|uniref:histidine kinase n=1 Tax=Cohnella herbarum TaxID=2728023 RepID=A0A7Z2ZP11_9BACL|nr:HAMP domain-containing sensor histidine kinase [Cohnella herbarum]QJD85567.1 HAMP domain-containing histidine kinase [Cohnella herbarum]
MPGYVQPAIIVFLLAASCFLLVKQWRYKQQLGWITARLNEIRGGSPNQRIRIHHAPESLIELGGSMNRLIDAYQISLERVNLLETERKKMISHLSHDLRTPLTAILGYVEVMQKDNSLSEEMRQNYYRIVVAKGNKLDALIRDFFELSKLEADNGSMEPEKLNVIDKVEEAVVSFYHQFELARLSPRLELPERPLYAWGNRQSLERIMNNLLSNALRYGADGGVVGIRVKDKEDRVWIEVWDRGQGISQTDMPHIFERLYTGSASRNSVQQGNGLGLTIVKKLVEKQHGEIIARSVPNGETVFAFCLPKAT